VDGQNIFTRGVLATAGADAEATATAMEGLENVAFRPALVLFTAASQVSLAVGDINNGISPTVAIGGHTANAAAIIGTDLLVTSIATGALEGGEAGAFLGPWGAVIGAGIGAGAAWNVAEHVPTGEQYDEIVHGPPTGP
jgi:hypothetical protein